MEAYVSVTHTSISTPPTARLRIFLVDFTKSGEKPTILNYPAWLFITELDAMGNPNPFVVLLLNEESVGRTGDALIIRMGPEAVPMLEAEVRSRKAKMEKSGRRSFDWVEYPLVSLDLCIYVNRNKSMKMNLRMDRPVEGKMVTSEPVAFEICNFSSESILKAPLWHIDSLICTCNFLISMFTRQKREELRSAILAFNAFLVYHLTNRDAGKL